MGVKIDVSVNNCIKPIGQVGSSESLRLSSHPMGFLLRKDGHDGTNPY